MKEIPWVLHKNEIYTPASLLLKFLLYFWAPPNFVELPFVVPPSVIFPVPYSLWYHNFFLLTIFFVTEILFFSTQPKGKLSMYLEFYANSCLKQLESHITLVLFLLDAVFLLPRFFSFLQYLSCQIRFQEAEKKTRTKCQISLLTGSLKATR